MSFQSILHLFTSTLWFAALLSCNSSEIVPLSKCCPDGLVYNVQEKRCVKSNYTSPDERIYLKTSEIPFGRDCAVVKENILDESEIYNSVVTNNTRLMYNNETFEFGQYCIDLTVNDKLYIMKLCYQKNFCKSGQDKMCLKKCCPDGHVFIKTNCTYVPMVSFDVTQVSNIFVDNTLNNYAATFYQKKKCPRYIATINNTLTLKSNGSIFLNSTDGLKEYTIDEEMYCVENLARNVQASNGRMIVLLCTTTNEAHFTISKYIMAFSCICHFLTIYFFSECRKIIQKAITAFCIAQTISFTTLSVLQFNLNLRAGSTVCSIAGYLHLYFSLAAILWLNVIAFEVCRTLRSMEKIQNNSKKFFDKLTIKYSLYAWGLAALITIFCSLDFHFHILPKHLHPLLGTKRCILENLVKDGNYSYAIYFLLPIALVIVTNSCLYVLTIKYYIDAKSLLRGFTETSSGNRPFKNGLKFYGNMLHIVLKLFAVMGCTWIFEIIFSLYDFKQHSALRVVENIIDTINELQGFIIYLIFVGTKHVCTNVQLLRRHTVNYFSSQRESKLSLIVFCFVLLIGILYIVRQLL